MKFQIRSVNSWQEQESLVTSRSSGLFPLSGATTGLQSSSEVISFFIRCRNGTPISQISEEE